MATAVRVLVALALALAATAGDSSSSSSSSSESEEGAAGAGWVERAGQVCPHPPRVAVSLDEVHGSWFVVESAGPEMAPDGQCHTLCLRESGDRLSLSLSSFINGSLVSQRSNSMARGDNGMWVDRAGEGWAMWVGRSRNGRLLLLCGLQGVGAQGQQPRAAFSLAMAPVPRVDEEDLREARGEAGRGAAFTRPPLVHCRPPLRPARPRPAAEDETAPDIQLLD